MAKKEIEEINAGSMADIAFLLLIFFLITTTMNLPQVHEERLPQKSEMEILLNKTNVLQIQATKSDKIAIEEEFAELEDIKEAVKDFYVHKKGDPRWPKYTPKWHQQWPQSLPFGTKIAYLATCGHPKSPTKPQASKLCGYIASRLRAMWLLSLVASPRARPKGCITP